MIQQIIKKRMNLLGLSQKELADKAGLTKAQMSMFLKGSSSLSQKSIERLFNILDINISMYDHRFDLAKEVAQSFIEQGLTDEDVFTMSKKTMSNKSKKREVLLFFDIDEHNVDEVVKTGIVDYESTFVFFKAMVVQMMISNLKFTSAAYSSSWDRLMSDKRFKIGILAGAALVAPLNHLGLLGLSLLGVNLFSKATLTTPFELLAKSMLKQK